MIVGPDFPIRCSVSRDGVPICSRPAVVAVLYRPACGCPDSAGAPVCEQHSEKYHVGYVATGRKHHPCGASNSGYTVFAHRPLNEGDLPDPEEVSNEHAPTRHEQ